jgi:hypothetical protein
VLEEPSDRTFVPEEGSVEALATDREGRVTFPAVVPEILEFHLSGDDLEVLRRSPGASRPTHSKVIPGAEARDGMDVVLERSAR